jgi:hypothetical protein
LKVGFGETTSHFASRSFDPLKLSLQTTSGSQVPTPSQGAVHAVTQVLPLTHEKHGVSLHARLTGFAPDDAQFESSTISPEEFLQTTS